MWIRITSPYFVAGVEFVEYEEGSLVSNAAPIVKYMKGWTKGEVLVYAKRKGWGVEEFPTPTS